MDDLIAEVPRARIDESGREILDKTPVAVPAGFKVPETLSEQVKRMVRHQLSDAASNRGSETFDEANDFDIEDDRVEPDTPFEAEFDPTLGREVTADEVRRDQEHYRAQFVKAAKEEADAALEAAQERGKRRPWYRRTPRSQPKDEPPPNSEVD